MIFETTTDTGGGQNAGSLANGDYLRFDNVDFGSPGANNVSARVASGAAAGVSGLVEFHLDTVTGPLIGSFPVEAEDQLMLVTDAGQVIRVPVDAGAGNNIRIVGRSSQGVTVFRTSEGERFDPFKIMYE